MPLFGSKKDKTAEKDKKSPEGSISITVLFLFVAGLLFWLSTNVDCRLQNRGVFHKENRKNLILTLS